MLWFLLQFLFILPAGFFAARGFGGSGFLGRSTVGFLRRGFAAFFRFLDLGWNATATARENWRHCNSRRVWCKGEQRKCGDCF